MCICVSGGGVVLYRGSVHGGGGRVMVWCSY